MDNINERIKLLRETLGLTQTIFSKKIKRAQNTIADYEKGKNIPERTIIDICDAFNVNEAWLRSGEGDMFCKPSSTDAELARAVGRLIKSDDAFTKKLVLEYLKLPPELKTLFEEFVQKLVDDQRE